METQKRSEIITNLTDSRKLNPTPIDEKAENQPVYIIKFSKKKKSGMQGGLKLRGYTLIYSLYEHSRQMADWRFILRR